MNITKESFRDMRQSDKLNILFDLTYDNYNRLIALEGRVECMRNRHWDKAISAAAGLIGGVATIVSYIYLWG